MANKKISVVNYNGTTYDVSSYSSVMSQIAEQANALSSPAYIDGVEFDGARSIAHYIECGSAGNESVKEIRKDDLIVTNGSHVTIKFLSNNTAENPMLKVGDITKPIYYNGSTISANKIKNNTVLDLIFDSTLDAWLCVGGIDQDIPDPVTYDLVTITDPGLMSPSDKNKLDSIDYSANYLTVEGTSPINVAVNESVATITHDDSGVVANTYGVLATSTISPGFGEEITIPGFTVDTKGHIIAAAGHKVKIPATEVGITSGLMTPAQAEKLEGIAIEAQPGTVTNIATGVGLKGGPITETGTIKVDLADETKLSLSSVNVEKTNAQRLYPVSLDTNGHLATYVPWTDTTYQTRDGSSSGYLASSTELNKLDTLSEVSFTRTLNSGVKIGTISIGDTDIDIYSTENTWIPLTGATALNDGIAGYVPTAPTAGQQNYYLAGDGTWKCGPSSNQDFGLISYVDLTKLQELPDFTQLQEMISGKITVLQLNYDTTNEQYILNPQLTEKAFSDLLQSTISDNGMLIVTDGIQRYYWVSLVSDKAGEKATFISNVNGLTTVLAAMCSESTDVNVSFITVESSADKAERATKDASGNTITETYLTTDNAWLATSTTNGTMSPSDFDKLSNIENEANKTILHNDQYITLYPSSGGATTQGEVTIGHVTSQASGNYGQYNSSNAETISASQETGYYKFDSIGVSVDGAGHVTSASQHEVRIPLANSSRDGLISSADYQKISNDVVSEVSATAPIIASIDNGDTLTISHTTTGANTLKGESTDLPSLQFGDSFKVLRENVDQYGLTTLLEEKQVTIPNYSVDNNRAGLMSPVDKIKLDGFEDAWNYATTDYVNAALSGLDPMIFKGVVNDNLELPQKSDPTLSNYDENLANGWTYRIGTAGVYNGYNLAAGDLIIMTDDGWFGISVDSNGALFKNPNVFANNEMLLADGTIGRVKSVAVNPSLDFDYYSTEFPHAKIIVGGFESNYISMGEFTASDSQYGFAKLTNLPLAQLETDPIDYGTILAATPKSVDEAIKLLDTTVTDSYIDENTEETVEVSNLYANKTLATLSEVDGIVQATFQPIQLDMTQITTGVLPIAQGGTGTNLLNPNRLLTVIEGAEDSFISTNHYVDDGTLYVNQDPLFTSEGLNISTVLPTAQPNLFVNGDSIITDGLDVFNYTKTGSAINLHGGTATGTSIISFYPDAPIHDDVNNTDTQQLIDTGFSAVGGFIRYDVGHDLDEHNSVQQGNAYKGDGASLTIGINGEVFNSSTNYYHNSRLILTAPAPIHLQFDASNGHFNIPTVGFDVARHFDECWYSPLIATKIPNVYAPNKTIKMTENRIEVGDYLGEVGEPSGAIYADQMTANEFVGALTGNADTATQWAAPTVTYVDLSTASTLTTLQGNESSPVALGVDGTLGIDHGGTGATTADAAKINLNIGNGRIFVGYSETNGGTAQKVVVCPDYKLLTDGDIVFVNFVNNNTSYSNLTLKVGTTAAKTIMYNLNGSFVNLTNAVRIKAGLYMFVYSAYLGAWIISLNDDTYNRIKLSDSIVKPAEAIAANRIIVGTDDGYIAADNGVSFNIRYPILYTDKALSSGWSDSAYSLIEDRIISSQSLNTTVSTSDLQKPKPLYLVGVLDGDIFTIDNVSPLTTTVPTEKDNKVYIEIGYTIYSTTKFVFSCSNKMFTYKNGAFVPMAAGAGGDGETSNIEEIIKLLPGSSTSPEDSTNRIFKWSGNTVTIYSENVTEDSTQIVSAPTDAFDFNGSTQALTLEKIEALSSATIIDGGQGVENGLGWFKLVAMSDVPEEETYIRVIYKYTADSNTESAKSAAASATEAAAAAAQAAAYAKMMVRKITLSSGNLVADSSNTTYPYKYDIAWTGVQSDDWVDGSGVSEMDWAVESKTNMVTLHFAKPFSTSTSINVYWAACDVIASSSPPQAPQYNITYNANGGYFGTNTSTTTNTVTYNFIQSGTNYEAIAVSGQVLTPNAMEGYTFNGWYTDQTYTTPLDLTKIPASNDITVYAKYEDTRVFLLPGENFLNTLMKPVGYSSFIEDYQVDGETDRSVKSFQRSLTEPDAGVTTVDISNSQDNSIIAWFNRNTRAIYWYSNASKVYTTNAFEMFAGLEGLESLDLSGINFYYTESMNSMFSSCYQLTSLDLSGIDTLNVTDMSDMFAGSGLVSLDLSNFNTQKVEWMSGMFGYCTSLKNLDLSSFDTSNVTDIEGMFRNCENLETIYVGSGWDMSKVEMGENVFDYDQKLVGGAGTAYNGSHVDKIYAHIDGGTSNPGYFTAKN